MTHVLEDLARDRQRHVLAAARERNASRIRQHSRTARQAARAERRQLRWQVSALRADLRKLESETGRRNLESAGEPR